MKLQNKNKNFISMEKCAGAFQKLKELLMTTLILKFPDMDKEFLV
jgi:hypothetical protein